MRSLYAAVAASDTEVLQSGVEGIASSGANEMSRPEIVASTAPIGFPTFGVYGQIYAVEARRAGRLNAAIVPEKEYQRLLRERQVLLDKKFDGTLSRREANKLEYIRWSLDRIEDARSGEDLDILESLASQYEQFRRDVERLKTDIFTQMPRHRK